MKTNTLTIILFAFFGMFSGISLAQVDNIGDLFQQAGEEYEQQQAIENPEGDTATQNQPTPTSQADQDRMDRWQRQFEANVTDFGDAVKNFNTPETRCIFAMVIFIDNYINLLELIEATDDLDCVLKYDLYGMQAMAIATSTTIINCPESLYKLNHQERTKVYDKLGVILNSGDQSVALRRWIYKYYRVVGRYGDGDEIEDLCYIFTPIYVIKELMLIRQKMEILGCGG